MKSDDGATYSTVQTVSATSATVTQLSVGHTYYFKVIAFNSGGNSPASNVFSITP
jgi:hypothetical protein